MAFSLIDKLAAIFVEPQLPDELRFPVGAPAQAPEQTPMSTSPSMPWNYQVESAMMPQFASPPPPIPPHMRTDKLSWEQPLPTPEEILAFKKYTAETTGEGAFDSSVAFAPPSEGHIPISPEEMAKMRELERIRQMRENPFQDPISGESPQSQAFFSGAFPGTDYLRSFITGEDSDILARKAYPGYANAGEIATLPLFLTPASQVARATKIPSMFASPIGRKAAERGLAFSLYRGGRSALEGKPKDIPQEMLEGGIAGSIWGAGEQTIKSAWNAFKLTRGKVGMPEIPKTVTPQQLRNMALKARGTTPLTDQEKALYDIANEFDLFGKQYITGKMGQEIPFPQMTETGRESFGEAFKRMLFTNKPIPKMGFKMPEQVPVSDQTGIPRLLPSETTPTQPIEPTFQMSPAGTTDVPFNLSSMVGIEGGAEIPTVPNDYPELSRTTPPTTAKQDITEGSRRDAPTLTPPEEKPISSFQEMKQTDAILQAELQKDLLELPFKVADARGGHPILPPPPPPPSGTLGRFTPDESEASAKTVTSLTRALLGKSQIRPAKVTARSFGEDVAARVVKMAHEHLGKVYQWENRSLINSTDESYNQLEAKLNKEFSEQQLEDIFALRGLPRWPEGEARYKLAQSRATPEMLKAVEIVQRITDDNYGLVGEMIGGGQAQEALPMFSPELQKAGFTIPYHEGYQRGLYESDNADVLLSHFYNKYSTDAFLQKKVIHSPADALGIGLKYKHKNPIANAKQEIVEASKLKAMRDSRDWLMQRGNGLYITESSQATPEQLTTWIHGTDEYTGYLMHPDLGNLVRNLISTNVVRTTKGLRALSDFGHVMRTYKLLFPMFHQVNVGLKQNLADNGPIAALLHPGQSIATTGKSLVTGKKHFPKQGEPNYDNYVRYLENGGDDRYNWEVSGLERFRGLADKMPSILKKAGFPIKVASFPLRKYASWVFEDYIPQLKWNKALFEISKKEQRLGRVLEDYEIQEIIKEGQNFFGEINEKLFGRSATATSATRLVAMAPGYWEGNVSSVLKGLLQWSDGKAWRSRYNILNSLLLTGSAAALGTWMFTGKKKEMPNNLDELRDMFKIETNWKDAEGNTVFIDLMTYDKDYFNLIVAPAANIAYDPSLKGAAESAAMVPSSVFNRLGSLKQPMISLASDASRLIGGETLTNRWGNPIYYNSDSVATKAKKIALYELTQLEPIPVSIEKQMLKKGVSPLGATAATMIGLRPTLSERTKRVKKLGYDIGSLSKRKSDLYSAFYSSKDPIKMAKKYNNDVTGILNRSMEDGIYKELTPERRKQFMELRIDMKVYLENKVRELSNPKLSPNDQSKIVGLLNNFGFTEADMKAVFLELSKPKPTEYRGWDGLGLPPKPRQPSLFKSPRATMSKNLRQQQKQSIAVNRFRKYIK